jgi:hypothetical protein
MKIKAVHTSLLHFKEDTMNNRFYNNELCVVKLYKNGMLMDYGVRSKIAEYRKQGYKVVTSDARAPIDAVLQREFDPLWAYLPEAEQARLHDIAIDDEMSTAERLMLLKSEVVRKPKRTITVTHTIHRKKPSIFERIKNTVAGFVESLLPQPAYAYA